MKLLRKAHADHAQGNLPVPSEPSGSSRTGPHANVPQPDSNPTGERPPPDAAANPQDEADPLPQTSMSGDDFVNN